MEGLLRLICLADLIETGRVNLRGLQLTKIGLSSVYLSKLELSWVSGFILGLLLEFVSYL